MAGMLSKLWDDVAGGSPPEKGMKQLRKQNSANSALFPSDGGGLPPEKGMKQLRKQNSANSGLFPSDGDTGEKSKFGRRLSLGEYQSSTPSQSIPMKKPLPMLDIPDSPCATPCSLGSTPPTSPSPSTYPKEKDNLWRSVFHSGQNKVIQRNLSTGADKVQESTSPTVYDWVVITALEG